METFCACKFPQGVNKCDERHHCGNCGYPLGPDDRRNDMLKCCGNLTMWWMLVRHAHGYRRSENAWDFLDRQFSGMPRRPGPPSRTVLYSIRLGRFVGGGFDPERE
jgi:hypothetical protein